MIDKERERRLRLNKQQNRGQELSNGTETNPAGPNTEYISSLITLFLLGYFQLTHVPKINYMFNIYEQIQTQGNKSHSMR